MKAAIFLISIIIVGVLSFYCGRLYEAQKVKLSDQISKSKFGQIEIALLAYYDDHMSFPPSKYQRKPGEPTHSWRVLLMPYMDSESQTRFLTYDFSENWDHQKNLKNLGSLAPALLTLDNQMEFSQYITIGSGEVFPTSHPLKSRLVARGSDKFLLVEYPHSRIFWMEPRY